MESGGASRRRSPCHTANVTGVSSTCTCHCAAIPGAGQVCGAQCGLACHRPPLCRPPCVLFPLQDPRRAWVATFGHSTSLDRSKAGAFNTLDAPPHLTRGSAHFYSYRHAVDWRHRTRTHSGHGERIRKDDDHDLRHAPQRSATGKTNCSLPDHGGKSRRPH